MAQDVFGIAGTTQGPFTIEDAVAEGGFGVVYKALHGAFRAPVALKCLKIPTIPENLRAGFLERFREEAEMLFRLSATIPEVVRPLHYDVISLDSGLIVPFIALEWLEGRTLWDLIEQRTKDGVGPLGYLEAARLLTPVARALETAHNFPGPTGPVCVIHRDIKPANIFLAQLHGAEVIKILDFGIARARDAASVMAGQMTQETTSVPLAFTPRYGAPEQWAPKRFGTTGPWTDVWGLAISFLETIAGRAVIDGDAVAIMGTVLDEKRRPTPRSEGIAVPDALEAVFRRALALDPRERPSNAGVFWDEVEAALGLPSSAVLGPGELRRSGAMRAYVADGQAEGRSPSGAFRVSDGRSPSGAFRVSDGRSPSGAFRLSDPGAEPRRTSSQSVRAPQLPPALEPTALVDPGDGGRSSKVPGEPKSGAYAAQREPKSGAYAAQKVDAEPPVARKGLPSTIDLDWGANGAGASGPPRRASSSISSMPAVRPPEEPSASAVREREKEPSRIGMTSVPSLPPPAPEVGSMLGVPVGLAVFGVLLRVLDEVYAATVSHGEHISLGPLRLAWLAALLIGVGAILALARFFRHVAR